MQLRDPLPQPLSIFCVAVTEDDSTIFSGHSLRFELSHGAYTDAPTVALTAYQNSDDDDDDDSHDESSASSKDGDSSCTAKRRAESVRDDTAGTAGNRLSTDSTITSLSLIHI